LTRTVADVYRLAQSEHRRRKREKQRQTNGDESDSLQDAAPPENLFDAAKRGCVDFIEAQLEREGHSTLSERDSGGLTAAHWASLSGQLGVLRFLAERGGVACCDMPATGKEELGQRPLHWACVNGHVPVIDFLLSLGADANTPDSAGATPLITACQHARTVAAAFLLTRGGAQAGAADCDGDTALHWAASRANPDLVRLLVRAGCEPGRRDRHGQAPLHLACAAGRADVARDLCELYGADPHEPDGSGRTPFQLAAAGRHEDVERCLRRHLLSRHAGQGQQPGRQRQQGLLARLTAIGNGGPAVFFVACLACFGYPVYWLRVRPLTAGLHPGAHAAFLLGNCVMWLAYCLAWLTNPGYVAKETAEYNRLMRLAGSTVADIGLSGMDNPLDRLCHTCRAVRPLRSKHCRVCDRCVRDMDHHCPYVRNCVGSGNRQYFAIMVTAIMFNAWISFFFAYKCLRLIGFDFILVLGTVLLILASLVAGFITTCVWFHATVNLTTNESINYERYSYLQDGRGNARNPFSRGPVSNLLEFFHLRSARRIPELTDAAFPLSV
ncbi:hypothetical protein BOX15_Mlig022279g1, partial [Macrostomum lignano]